MLNVLIADSHPVARAGLHMLVEQVAERLGDECLIAYSDDALTAFRKAKRLQPDLILLSSNLRLTGGVQTVLALRAYAPRTKLVIVSDDDDQEAVLRAYIDAGADGVLRKRESSAAIEERIGELLREFRRPVGR
jgi:DNA-binding NarL/FixJ family response regulator